MERAGPHWVDIPPPQKSYAIPELLSDHVEFSTRMFLGNSEHQVQARRYWACRPEYRMIGSMSRPVISSTEAVRAVFPRRRAHQRESQATLDPLEVMVMNSPGSPVPEARKATPLSLPGSLCRIPAGCFKCPDWACSCRRVVCA